MHLRRKSCGGTSRAPSSSGAHPEIASSAYAFVVRTHEAEGYVYVTVKVHGKNGKDVEALYEVVREGTALKVNAVSSRRDDGVL
jgi:hypothetical protein